ncbi:MAG TPA: hypothetical protein VKZ91_14995 [Woeseiaceae bacterium]|nr:hypothetical protein [Woeseiaceae bacterium]
MDLDTLAKLGEFVGGFFVVLSLVYLAHQVRMNTKSLRSENYARLLERMSTLQSRVAAEPDLNRVFTVGSEDPGRLTRSERIRYAWALYDMFGTAEFMFHQSRAKALPKGVWTRWEATIGWWFSHPGVRAWWAAKPSPLTADFEAFAGRLIEDKRFDAAAVDRWHRFVNGEGLSIHPPATSGGDGTRVPGRETGKLHERTRNSADADDCAL